MVGVVRYILHVADVHVRSGAVGKARRKEYEYVIDNLVSVAAELAAAGGVLTVVAGDVLHDRSTLDPHSIAVFRAFVVGLARHGEVVIIQGNHDHHPMHDDRDTPHDVLGSLIDLANLERVRYLDRSGYYVVGGIGFGVLTVHDTVPVGEARSGRTVLDDLAFPPPEDPRLFNVALYHGPVEGSRGDGGPMAGSLNGSRGVPLSVFDGYDAVMLGDQHLQQIGNHVPGDGGIIRLSEDGTKVTWAYPGSLLQQGHGESLWNHGAIVWDVTQKTLVPRHVRNRHGFVTLQGDSILYDNSWQPVARHLADPDFPEIVHARTRGDASAAIACLEAAGVQVDMSSSSSRQQLRLDCTGPIGSASASEPFDWRVAVRDQGIEIESLLEEAHVPAFKDPGLRELADARNARLEKTVKAFRASSGSHARTAIRPTRLRWDWMLCFGEGNDVGIFGDDGVVLVSAPNGAGKTAFLEILVYALFGEGIPSRCSRGDSASVINIDMPRDASAFAEVWFEKDDVQYRVSRRWTVSSRDGTKASCKNAEVSIASANGSMKAVTLCKGRVAVDEWVSQNVCTAADFMAGPLLSQAGDGDFLSLSPKDMATLLERAFGLAGIDTLQELLVDGANAQKQVLSRFDMLGKGVTRAEYDAAEAAFLAAKAAAKDIEDKLLPLGAMKPTVGRDELEAARAILADEKYGSAGKYDPAASALDDSALASAKKVVLPVPETFRWLFPDQAGSDVPVPASAASDMWARYEATCRKYPDMDHRALRQDSNALKRVLEDCGGDPDTLQSNLALAKRALADVSKQLERDQVALEDARDQLRRAVAAQSGVIETRLAASMAALEPLWLGTGMSCATKDELLLEYIASCSHTLPSGKRLAEVCSFSVSLGNFKTLADAVRWFGGSIPTASASGCPDGPDGPDVPDVPSASARVARLTVSVSQLETQLLDAVAAHDRCAKAMESVGDADHIRNARALEDMDRAAEPMRGIDVEAVRAGLAEDVARLTACVRTHRHAKKRQVAESIVNNHSHASERESLLLALRAVGLEEASLEWGRVRGAKAALDDEESAAEARRRMTVLTEAASKLRASKAWLYRERVAPQVQARVNDVVSRVEPGLRAVCTVVDEGIAWSMADSGRVIAMSRASGFQRFMISTALRIVVGGMLAPCKVVAIDEGFTACDDAHLAKVPDFLEWLVQNGHARTVVLVSHLTEIRSRISRVVEIQRPFVG